jgi:hypothetical protein
MFDLQQTVSNRKVSYLDVKINPNDFINASLQNWMVVVVANELKDPLLHRLAKICIDKELMYMCACGDAGREIDDLFDELFVIRQIDEKPMPYWYHSKEEDVLMTTWHNSYEECFWYAATLANYDPYVIERIVVLNFNNASFLTHTKELILKINNGWSPDI